jgi:hypothetical protein
MLIHPNCWELRCIALLGLMTVFGEVTDLSTIVARVTSRCELLWWPDCHLILLRWRRAVVLLLLWVVALELWWRLAQLSHRWCIDHAVLGSSTTRTTSGGSRHSPLPLLLFGRFIGPSWCPLGQWQHLLAHCMTSSEIGSGHPASE